MRYTKTLILIHLLFLCTTLTAQKIEGIVLSSEDKSPLTGVSIVELSDNGDMGAFSVTDANGQYILEADCLQDSISVEFSYLGYKTLHKKVKCTDTKLEVILESLDYEIDEVTIKEYRIGMMQKGDTLVYDHKAYSDGTERKLKDILNKLPGVDIDDNNTLTVQGKKVDILSVNNDDFMNKNRSSLLNNLDTDNLVNIEYTDLYDKKEGRVLSKLNIVTNQFKPNYDLKIGLGTEMVKMLNLSTTAISDKFKYIASANYDDGGKKLFSTSDMIAFSGIDNLQNTTLPKSQQKAAQNRNHLGSFNGSWALKNHDLKINFINLGNDRFFRKQSIIYSTEENYTNNITLDSKLNFTGINAQLERNENKYSYKLHSFFGYQYNRNQELEKYQDFTLMDSLSIHRKSNNYIGNITGTYNQSFSENHLLRTKISFQGEVPDNSNNWAKYATTQSTETLYTKYANTNFSASLHSEWDTKGYIVKSGIDLSKTDINFKDYQFINNTSNERYDYLNILAFTGLRKKIGDVNIFLKAGIQSLSLKDNYLQRSPYLYGDINYNLAPGQFLQFTYTKEQKPYYISTPLGMVYDINNGRNFLEISELNNAVSTHFYRLNYGVALPIQNIFIFSMYQRTYHSNGITQQTLFREDINISKYVGEGTTKDIALFSIDKKWNKQRIAIKNKFLYLNNQIPQYIEDIRLDTKFRILNNSIKVYTLNKEGLNFGTTFGWKNISTSGIADISQDIIEFTPFIKGRALDNKLEWSITHNVQYYSNLSVWQNNLYPQIEYFTTMNNYKVSFGIETMDILDFSNNERVNLARVSNGLTTESRDDIQNGYVRGFFSIHF